MTPAGRVEPPADLLADLTTLRGAVAAGNAQEVAPFLAPTVTILNGAIDLHVPRRAEPLGPSKDARAALIELGQNTGGDWDPSSGPDLDTVLVAHALEFWRWSLEDEALDWGLDPMAPGAICTYEAQVFDPGEVARVAEQMGVASASFVMVQADEPAFKLPGVRASVDTFKPGNLYVLDYDTDTPSGGMAVHMPAGGEGFLFFGENGMLRPYMTGLCFEKGVAGRWQVTVQTNTSL